MDANQKSNPEIQDRELLSGRVFQASRQRVFQAWADPAQVRQWWGPKGFSCGAFEAFDLRPGGEWRFDMIGPKGERYHNLSHFLEIREGELIRFEHRAPHFFTTVRFSDEAGGCRVSWSMLFDSAQAYHQIKEIVVKGNEENLDKLEAFLAAQRP